MLKGLKLKIGAKVTESIQKCDMHKIVGKCKLCPEKQWCLLAMSTGEEY